MKLILKVAAGIIVAWVLILGTGLIVGLLTAKAVTGSTLQTINQQQEQLLQQTERANDLAQEHLYQECLKAKREYDETLVDPSEAWLNYSPPCSRR
jgi:hypothetical protein